MVLEKEHFTTFLIDGLSNISRGPGLPNRTYSAGRPHVELCPQVLSSLFSLHVAAAR